MSILRRLASRIFYSSTRELKFHAGVRRNDPDLDCGVRPVKIISTPAKIIGDVVYDVGGHCSGVGAAVAHCLPTGSFTLGGERCLAWLGSPAAPTCCLLDRVRRARELLFVRPC